MVLPPNSQPPPDPGALAMRSAAELGEAGTIATAQLIGGLSGLMVSEGLARVLRDLLGTAGAPEGASASRAAVEPGQESAPSGVEGDALAGLSAKAMKELVAQGVAGRIIALNTVNTYLSLATAEQLRRIGTQIAGGEAAAPSSQPAAQAPAQAPAPAPAMTWQVPPGYTPYGPSVPSWVPQRYPGYPGYR